MTRRRPLRAPVAVLLGLALAGGLPAVAVAEDTLAFRIRVPAVTESSGLVRSEAGGYYWTANDSGDSGRVFAVRPDGRLRGTLTFRAQPTDVEALAMAGSRLYVADIGDNDATREQVSVYWLENAEPSGLTVTYNAWDFRYPDGPHDAETLLVDPDGRLLVVTKGAQGGVYAAPESPSRTQLNTLRRVADAPPLVTDGVWLPDGDRVALLTATRVVVVDGSTWAEVAEAPVPSAVTQAETLALDLDGEHLLVGGEGADSPVYQVDVPGAEPSPTPTPSADTGDEGELEDVTSTDPGGSGMLPAVGLAALVALVAAAVVFVVRGRPGAG